MFCIYTASWRFQPIKSAHVVPGAWSSFNMAPLDVYPSCCEAPFQLHELHQADSVRAQRSQKASLFSKLLQEVWPAGRGRCRSQESNLAPRRHHEGVAPAQGFGAARRSRIPRPARLSQWHAAVEVSNCTPQLERFGICCCLDVVHPLMLKVLKLDLRLGLF